MAMFVKILAILAHSGEDTEDIQVVSVHLANETLQNGCCRLWLPCSFDGCGGVFGGACLMVLVWGFFFF